MAICAVFLSLVVLSHFGSSRSHGGLLYPRESETREVKELNGMWYFRADSSTKDPKATGWHLHPLQTTGDTILMPVPSSFNDITQSSTLREFVGWVWYQREFWVPMSWMDGKTRIVLRIDSAHYHAVVFVNDKRAKEHEGGHLPFQVEITNFVKLGVPNLITVAIDNTLTPLTLPPATTKTILGKTVQNLQFDFFNYAGLHRPVRLYTTPRDVYIADITVRTSVEGQKKAKIDYTIEIGRHTLQAISVSVQIVERLGGSLMDSAFNQLSECQEERYCAQTAQGSLEVSNPHLWWPWTMSDTPGYLYTLQVTATTEDGVEDVYRLPIGIRTVAVHGNQFLINGKPFYFTGFGKHEDADIRGRGMDYPIMMKDINLLKWIGANSFRTSHYPYAEELMELCDQHGIVVVDEAPAVGMKNSENFGDQTLEHHIQVMHELIQRDKNRPSVVMWSVANEPASDTKVAKAYFKKVTEVTRNLDSTRPITLVTNRGVKDQAAEFLDILSINRYYGWYHVTGHPEAIYSELEGDLTALHTKFNLPIMIAEYGAGAIAGFHDDPGLLYSEDYQVEVLLNHFKVFDVYKKKFLIGEMIWNFADFQTGQYTGRANGNRKGIFTRQRRPKASAHFVRQRYHSLSQNKDLCFGYTLTGAFKECQSS